MEIFVRGVGVGYTRTEKLLLRRNENCKRNRHLEAEAHEGPKEPDIGRVIESSHNLLNKYSINIIPANKEFILTDSTFAIAFTAETTFRSALAADFKRDYNTSEFLWKEIPGIIDVAALQPAASQTPGEYLCFLATRATEKQQVDPDDTRRLPSEEWSERTLASGIRPKPMTTASLVAVSADICDLF